jgi:hypothetical protein
VKKLAANYLISEAGIFLKNGIIVAKEDGTAVELIDTGGDLDEIAQLTFHNGILISGYVFTRTNTECQFSESDHFLSSIINQSVAELSQISIPQLIELGKHVQEQFPEMKVPEIMDEITVFLLDRCHFRKEKIPGIFLLIGVDLPGLHFTSRTKLKKIV